MWRRRGWWWSRSGEVSASLTRVEGRAVTAHFDEYRLVEDLTTIRSPAFRRTTHRVGVAEARALATRYARAWARMRELTVESSVEVGSACWTCRSW